MIPFRPFGLASAVSLVALPAFHAGISNAFASALPPPPKSFSRSASKAFEAASEVASSDDAAPARGGALARFVLAPLLLVGGARRPHRRLRRHPSS